MMDYNGLTELSPLGLPQLTMRLDANSGKHEPRHNIYANNYYSNPDLKTRALNASGIPVNKIK